jgi:tetratricopeptide (TPR) repeat protein
MALHALGMTAWLQGDKQAAIAVLQEAADLFRRRGEHWALALALFSLGDTLMALGEDEAARASYEESDAEFKQAGDAVSGSTITNSLGRLAWLGGDYERARALVSESLAIRRAAAFKYFQAISLATLAEVARCQMSFDEAISLSQESIALYRELGEISGIAWGKYNLGYVAYYQGDYTRADTLLKEALETRSRQENKEGVVLCLAALACVAARTDRFERAAVLSGAADVRLEALDARLSPADRRDYEQVQADAGGRRGDKSWSWERARQEGREMSTEEAVAFALEGKEIQA